MPTSRTNLRPVRDVALPSLQFRTIHGHRRAFRIAGSGPALLLIHGVGDNSTTWNSVHAKLAQRFTVIAPDLLGHGESDKPRADYSLAAFANGMRDLLAVLGIDRATIVGHSLGGGVAAQFAYQYPQMVERLVLVSSGGVTKDVTPMLRLAALPMGAEALAALRLPGAKPALKLAGLAAKTSSVPPSTDAICPAVSICSPGCRPGGTVGVLAHSAVGGRRPRAVRHHARPQLSHARRPDTNHLGRRRHGDSGEPRPDCP